MEQYLSQSYERNILFYNNKPDFLHSTPTLAQKCIEQQQNCYKMLQDIITIQDYALVLKTQGSNYRDLTTGI